MPQLILLFSIHSIYLNRVFANGYKMKTIVLDAGHGGHDSGCHGHDGSYEKDVTLKAILALGKLVVYIAMLTTINQRMVRKRF